MSEKEKVKLDISEADAIFGGLGLLYDNKSFNATVKVIPGEDTFKLELISSDTIKNETK